MDNTSSQPVYRRILLKLSGEALQGDNPYGIDPGKLSRITQEVHSIKKLGVEVAMVIGGGNLIRGVDFYPTGFDRVTADQMGMLATMINGLALREAFQQKNIPATVMSAIATSGFVENYNRQAAQFYLKQGHVVIFVGGTGNPLVTTDTAAAMRAVEINADIVLKATKVDGVFASDPVKNPKAERYTTLTYNQVLEQRLGVMDLTAILLCSDNTLPLRVFNMTKQGALQRIVLGEDVGTLVQSGDS